MVRIIKKTQQRVVTMPHIGDVIEFSNSGHDAVDQESVPIIGPWEDTLIDGVTTSGGPPSRQQLMWGGHGNKLQGTTAALMGAELDSLNVVGQRKSTHRRRKTTVSIDT